MVQATATPASLVGVLEELIALQTGSALTNEGVDLDAGLREATTQILDLRAVLRERCEATEALREEAAAAKMRLDESGLVLKNLAYEKDHHAKETAACRAFKSAFSDEELELIPVEEFLKAWGGVDKEEDPHQLMLNRLTHEIAYRKETLQRLETLRSQRDALASDVARARGELSGLEAELVRLHADGLALAKRCGAALPSLPRPGPQGNENLPIERLPAPLQSLAAALAGAAMIHSTRTTPGAAFEVRVVETDAVELRGRSGNGEARFAAAFRMDPAGGAVLATALDPASAAHLKDLCVGQATPHVDADVNAGARLHWLQVLAGLGHESGQADDGAIAAGDGSEPMDTEDGRTPEALALEVLDAIAELCMAGMQS